MSFDFLQETEKLQDQQKEQEIIEQEGVEGSSEPLEEKYGVDTSDLETTDFENVEEGSSSSSEGETKEEKEESHVQEEELEEVTREEDLLLNCIYPLPTIDEVIADYELLERELANELLTHEPLVLKYDQEDHIEDRSTLHEPEEDSSSFEVEDEDISSTSVPQEESEEVHTARTEEEIQEDQTVSDSELSVEELMAEQQVLIDELLEKLCEQLPASELFTFETSDTQLENQSVDHTESFQETTSQSLILETDAVELPTVMSTTEDLLERAFDEELNKDLSEVRQIDVDLQEKELLPVETTTHEIVLRDSVVQSEISSSHEFSLESEQIWLEIAVKDLSTQVEKLEDIHGLSLDSVYSKEIVHSDTSLDLDSLPLPVTTESELDSSTLDIKLSQSTSPPLTLDHFLVPSRESTELTLEELEDVLQKVSVPNEHQDLQGSLIEKSLLFSYTDQVTIPFHNESWLNQEKTQEYSTVLSSDLQSIKLSIFDDLLPEFSSEKLNLDLQKQEQLLLELNSPRNLRELSLDLTEEFQVLPEFTVLETHLFPSSLLKASEIPSISPYLIDPPPYDFLEEQENITLWNAQSEKVAQSQSRTLAENFDQGKDEQLYASLAETTPNSKDLATEEYLSFSKEISHKKDPITKEKLPWGDIMLPSPLLKNQLPEKFPGFQQGDFFQIKITNIRVEDSKKEEKSGIHTCKVSRRIQFTKLLSDYFDYQIGDRLMIEFQKHIPQSSVETFSLPVISIARFKQYSSSNSLYVTVPKNVRILMNLVTNPVTVSNQNQPLIHWIYGDRQGLGKYYGNKTIGITPEKIGLKSQPQEFVGQITLNSNLSPTQINDFIDQSQSAFAAHNLEQYRKVTGINFTGDPRQDKEPMLEFIVLCLVREGNFVDVEKIEFHVDVQVPKELQDVYPFLKPDGILRRMNQPKFELVEGKAFKDKGIFNVEDAYNQLTAYKALGYRVNLITTLNMKDISVRIKNLCDNIYSYEDLNYMVLKSKNPILSPMLELIREVWT